MNNFTCTRVNTQIHKHNTTIQNDNCNRQRSAAGEYITMPAEGTDIVLSVSECTDE